MNWQPRPLRPGAPVWVGPSHQVPVHWRIVRWYDFDQSAKPRYSIIEVKCSFSAFTSSSSITQPKPADQDKVFCLRSERSDPRMKRDHPYFWQVQGHMVVTNSLTPHNVILLRGCGVTCILKGLLPIWCGGRTPFFLHYKIFTRLMHCHISSSSTNATPLVPLLWHPQTCRRAST